MYSSRTLTSVSDLSRGSKRQLLSIDMLHKTLPPHPPASLSGLCCRRSKLSRRSNSSQRLPRVLCFLCTSFVFRTFPPSDTNAGSRIESISRMFILYPSDCKHFLHDLTKLYGQNIWRKAQPKMLDNYLYRNTLATKRGRALTLLHSSPVSGRRLVQTDAETSHLPTPSNVPSYHGVGRDGELPHTPPLLHVVYPHICPHVPAAHPLCIIATLSYHQP